MQRYKHNQTLSLSGWGFKVRSLALFILSFGACTILIGNRAPEPCDGKEPRCDGSVLVQCAQGIEIKKDCAPSLCDPVALACVDTCGDAIPSGDEECDDGNQDNTDTCKNNCEANV